MPSRSLFRLGSLALAGIAALSFAGAAGSQGTPGSAVPFGKAFVHFEQNVTDKDAEVVFDVKGVAEGLTKLTVVAPNGKTVVDFNASDAATLGMRKFMFESPEPQDVANLKAAYPEGEYVFSGVTFSGATLSGRATLHHALPPTATFVRPMPESKDVRVRGLSLAWTPVAGVDGYIVGIEQKDLGLNVTAKLPATASTFVVPEGFLTPNTDYVMELGTVMKDGNASFVETTFRTGAR